MALACQAKVMIAICKRCNDFFAAAGYDCEGVRGGTKKVDRCGKCGGDGESCNLKDVYVRWGRSDCRNGTKMLFSGHAAGYN